VKAPRFEVYQDKKLAWRWRLKAANGRIVAQGEAHTRERDAWRAVETVRLAAVKAAG
jgi:uncharacterized protein YegP (UPF0339 family)